MASQEPVEPVEVLYLTTPIPDTTGRLKLTKLTSDEATWKFHQHPAMIQIFVWVDREQGIADVHSIPISHIRSIRAPRRQIRKASSIVKPPGGLIVGAH